MEAGGMIRRIKYFNSGLLILLSVAFFLFPSIYIYDSNLGSSADHVLAFFAAPALIATVHVCRSFSRGAGAVLAICLAGAALTKYQGFYIVAAAGLIVSVAWLSAWYELRFVKSNLVPRWNTADLWWAPVIVLGLCAILVSPHFLKNYILYKNPVYPFMLEWLTIIMVPDTLAKAVSPEP